MNFINRIRLSLGVGFLAWVARIGDIRAIDGMPWAQQWNAKVMPAGAFILVAVFFALIFGRVIYRTHLKVWWYPNSRISNSIFNLSLLGLVVCSSMPRAVPANLDMWRSALFFVFFFGVFAGMMGFSSKAFGAGEQDKPT